MGKQWGRSFLESSARGPHIYKTFLNFPGKDFFPTATETRNGRPWVFTIQGPKTCPLKRQKRNCPFSYPSEMIWEETLFFFFFPVSFTSFCRKGHLQNHQSPNPHTWKGFWHANSLSPRQEQCISHHRFVTQGNFWLTKITDMNLWFYGWMFLMWMRGQQSSPPHCFFCIQGLSGGLWCHL